MNKPDKQNYTSPAIHVVEFRVELGQAVSPNTPVSTEVTWTDDPNTTESNHFGLESFSNTQTW